MNTYVFPDHKRGAFAQILVTVYDDNSATVAFRDSVGSTWGIPAANVTPN
jgi:hypothetical protein